MARIYRVPPSGAAALMLGFLLNLLTGYTSLRQMEMPPLKENVPISRELTAVPFFPQHKYQCGPAALAMAMSYSGVPVGPEDLVDEVYTPGRKGSLQSARRHGRLAYEISDLASLFPEIAAGYPVIIQGNNSFASPGRFRL